LLIACVFSCIGVEIALFESATISPCIAQKESKAE